MIRLVREAGISKGIRAIVVCPTIYGAGRGMQPNSDQLPKLIALSNQLGVRVYFGKGLNRYSSVHIRRSFFFAQNSDASFKEIAEMMSYPFGFEGRTVSLSVEDVVRRYGDIGRYGVTSNSRVSALNARRLGWSPKAPLLPNT
jgi:nucleoside-diphosphate-sugar epimerase